MSRLVMGPFNRVEGDLEVSLEVAAERVAAAWVTAPLYRGFENMVLGKAPLDALVIVPRICGICSVAQSAACAAALADAMGLATPDNGRLARNLIQAGENVADHLTHFYLFFMPDFARAAYANRPWFDGVAERFKATRGSATADMLPARAGFLRLQGYLAGKWPHTLALQPGGSTRAVLAGKKSASTPCSGNSAPFWNKPCSETGSKPWPPWIPPRPWRPGRRTGGGISPASSPWPGKKVWTPWAGGRTCSFPTAPTPGKWASFSPPGYGIRAGAAAAPWKFPASGKT